ncbi:hypothetical protein BLNAU_1596 [Blattamonas nauphoetae]|uniref:Cyclin N-terminal domain-containing protein n=1 Tax=Blattamonas nauphoetae TaxID=2049346 RepID=A0ABQ9YIH6_9EUKA|nr:hypothetical protein BLNAU_1596 [Blattamonas nauphoetae]
MCRIYLYLPIFPIVRPSLKPDIPKIFTCFILSINLQGKYFPNLISRTIPKSHGQETPTISNTDRIAEISLCYRIYLKDLLFVLSKIFSHLEGKITLTRGETVLALCLMLNFIFSTSREENTQKQQTLLNEHNYGTVLVCTLIVTLKLMRDSPPLNRIWCDIFTLPLHVICESEMTLLKQLDYQVFPNADLFLFLSHVLAN